MRSLHVPRRFRPKTIVLFLSVLAAHLSLACSVVTEDVEAKAVVAPAPLVQLAICLDTSGSMDGLIESAKQKLWAVVNDLALAEPNPRLEVALLTFGNDGHSVESGWVAVQVPFTDDLDEISAKLFALRTNGGTEYVGRVLQSASGLEWATADAKLKMIVVAGNESADQDPEVRFQEICADLKQHDVIVNSVYCGRPEEVIAAGWRDVAVSGLGEFASIDHDHGMVVIATPFDDELGDLSESLNTTYIPIGAKGAAGVANQTAQDSNAATLNSAAKAARAKTKASGLYSCSWDLIDACKSGQVKVAELDKKELPKELQAMPEKELLGYIETKAAERAAIQEQIAELAAKRDQFVQEEMKRQSLDDSASFDHAIRQAVRRQAQARGFVYPGSATPEDNAALQPADDTTDDSRTELLNYLAQPESRPQAAQPRSSALLANLEPQAVVTTEDADLTPKEMDILRGLIARADEVRRGWPEESYEVAGSSRVHADLVIILGDQSDWEALTRVLRRDRDGVLYLVNGQVGVRLDGRLVVISQGC